MNVKTQIRSEFLSLRMQMERNLTEQYSVRICALLKKSEAFLAADTVYFYYPLKKEVNLLPLAETALRMGKQIGFPKTEGDSIKFYLVSSLEQFSKEVFQVMEPISEILLTKEKPLILTPGIVFDKQKNRMGYGKGYYDRYGADFPGSIRIGVTYDGQVVDEIPTDRFDIPMQKIVTESGMW